MSKSVLKRLLIFGGLVAFVAVAAAAGNSGPPPSKSEYVSVPWSDYSPAVRERIDRALVNQDCRALQIEFDTADGNNKATMNRTGHGNTELMNYIDDSLRAAGCYK